ncbi:MAG TPA: class I SAM-dependent methyltransferase [Candidatus Polarisedimenticolaceae bacterium]
MDDREDMRRRALESHANGDATGWFDELYRSVDGDWSRIPWAKLAPNPHLIEWLASEAPGADRSCLVVGCGLGDDAEALASAGFDVTAFDVAPTAIATAKRRFPKTAVRYEVADALAPPASWAGRFAFVFESYTLQALPVEARAVAIRSIAGFVAPTGRLLLLCRGREDEPPSPHPPFPLSDADLAGFLEQGLVVRSFERFMDAEEPPVRRFRVVYRRGGTP